MSKTAKSGVVRKAIPSPKAPAFQPGVTNPKPLTHRGPQRPGAEKRVTRRDLPIVF